MWLHPQAMETRLSEFSEETKASLAASSDDTKSKLQEMEARMAASAEEASVQLTAMAAETDSKLSSVQQVIEGAM